MKDTGWNPRYFNPFGKNIMFIKDTDHTSTQVGEEIYQVAKKLTAKGCDSFFLEGDNVTWVKGGKCIQMLSPAHIKEDPDDYRSLLFQDLQYMSRIKNLIGADSRIFLESSLKYIHDFDTSKKQLEDMEALGRTETKEYHDTQKHLKDIRKTLIETSELRGDYAAKKIIYNIRELDIQTPTVIFGAAHFEKMRDKFLERGIGVISYLPESTTGGISAQEYMTKLAHLHHVSS